MGKTEEIMFHGRSVLVERKRIKHFNIRVDAEGQVFLSVPEERSEQEILDYLESMHDWITDAMEEMRERYDPSYRPEEIVVQDLPMVVRRRSVRKITMRVVPPGGTVEVTVPVWMVTADIIRHVTPYVADLKSSLDRVREHFPVPMRYENGEKHMLWGEEHTLREERAVENLVQVRLGDNGTIVLSAPEGASFERRRAAMQSWYKQYVLQALYPMVLHQEQVMGFSVRYSCRYMKTRWGSCTPSRNEIRLNLVLAKHPKSILEYVLIHEMCHILVARHNACFYDVLAKYCPKYREAEAYLRSASASIYM